MKLKKKRCAHCRQWFSPDPRTVRGDDERSCQRYCSQAACQKASAKEARAKWLAKNPDYYKGEARKTKVRLWAEDYPCYWKNWRQDHEDYRRREALRHRFKRLERVAKQDEIRQNPLGYLEGVRLLAAKTVAKQDEIRPCLEGMIDFLIVREAVAKQDEIVAAQGRVA